MIAFPLGMLGWTLTEYVLHRFDGHGMRGKTPFSKEHLAHHRDPLYFAAAWKKGLAAVLVAGLIAPIACTLAGVGSGVSFTAGFVLMYLGYEVIHRRIHTHAPIGAYGRWARRHHLQHHHVDPSRNHGVTSPIWDHVFGTLFTAETVQIPRRRAPLWLQTEAGQLRHGPEFVLEGSKSVA